MIDVEPPFRGCPYEGGVEIRRQFAALTKQRARKQSLAAATASGDWLSVGGRTQRRDANRISGPFAVRRARVRACVLKAIEHNGQSRGCDEEREPSRKREAKGCPQTESLVSRRSYTTSMSRLLE